MRTDPILARIVLLTLACLCMVKAETVYENKDCEKGHEQGGQEPTKGTPDDYWKHHHVSNDYWKHHHVKPKSRLPTTPDDGHKGGEQTGTPPPPAHETSLTPTPNHETTPSHKDIPDKPRPNPVTVGGGVKANPPVTVPPKLSFDNSFSGDATLYGSDGGGGACGYHGYTIKGLPTIAIGADIFGNGEACGACVFIQANDQTKGTNVTAQVNNKCPECVDGVDLTDDAWKKLTWQSPGRIPVTTTFVPCGITDDIVIDFISRGNAYDARFNFMNLNYAIAKAEVSLGNDWVELMHHDTTSLVPADLSQSHNILSQDKFAFRLTNALQDQVICSGVTLDKLNQATSGYACPGFQFPQPDPKN